MSNRNLYLFDAPNPLFDTPDEYQVVVVVADGNFTVTLDLVDDGGTHRLQWTATNDDAEAGGPDDFVVYVEVEIMGDVPTTGFTAPE